MLIAFIGYFRFWPVSDFPFAPDMSAKREGPDAGVLRLRGLLRAKRRPRTVISW
jgi:hypothetical protein